LNNARARNGGSQPGNKIEKNDTYCAGGRGMEKINKPNCRDFAKLNLKRGEAGKISRQLCEQEMASNDRGFEKFKDLIAAHHREV